MAIENEIKLLRDIPLLSTLSDDTIRLIAFGSERIILEKDRVLFHENEEASCGFLILTGTINLIKNTDSESKTVETVSSGALIGELALISHTARPCGAVTASPCVLLRINRSLIHRILGEYPELASQFHAHILMNFTQFLKNIARIEDKFS
jgi:CRP-like cAMP-binding protein